MTRIRVTVTLTREYEIDPSKFNENGFDSLEDWLENENECFKDDPKCILYVEEQACEINVKTSAVATVDVIEP